MYTHKHVRDIMTIAIQSGVVKVLTPDGKETGGANLNGGKLGFVG